MMAEDRDNPPVGQRGELTRREFLLRGALGAGAASLIVRADPSVLADTATPADDKLPDVVQVRSEEVVTTYGVHEGVLLDLLNIVLRRSTGKAPDDAWRSILHPDDVIALKFNRSGADALATTDPMLRVLVHSLAQAGFSSDRLVAVEVTHAARQETHTKAPQDGWSAGEHDFGSGRDQLAAWLDQVTAIINVPFLKTHNIAGVTGCLKNLSHALVKHPAQFHANGCSPFIGDIVALPAIRGKLRFHLVNALRSVFDGGPEASEEGIWDGGMLLGGFDPVALDAVGVQLLDRVRRELHLPSLTASSGPPAYLAAAASRGLGTDKLHQIHMLKVKL